MNQSIQVITSILLFVLLSPESMANEPHYANPTRFVLSGSDIYGNDAYEMTFDFERDRGEGDLVSLHIRIYEKEVTADKSILEAVSYVHFDQIDLTNDAGVFGSYFYGSVPYGPIAKCRKARKDKLSKYIHISNLDTMNGGDIILTLRDPCKD